MSERAEQALLKAIATIAVTREAADGVVLEVPREERRRRQRLVKRGLQKAARLERSAAAMFDVDVAEVRDAVDATRAAMREKASRAS